MSEKIIVYTSTYCLHSRSVVRLLKKNNIEAEIISIDGNPEAREKVMAINHGNASVPTIVFPDGTYLTEPSSSQLRARFNLPQSSLSERLKGILGKDDQLEESG
ncbi:MAG: glutaredoxin family protein [Candidatus Promineifilaceae bacterium]|jgi:mycoredoxin